MSTIVLKRSRKSYELLERILNKTTLHTQRVAHGQILDAGEFVMKGNFVDHDAEKEKAVKDALIIAEKRHAREIKASQRRLEDELEKDKLRALARQKHYYEALASKVREERDKAEEKRRKELLRHFEREKEEALRKQWEEAERVKQEAVQDACDKLQRRLRNEFALEREKAIAAALAKARELFRQRELETIERTRKQCEEEARQEAARVVKIHQDQIRNMEERYQALLLKYSKEVEHKARVENDFKDLQTDYKRFMDHTDGKYHSDYMMHLRKHGLRLAGKRVSVVTYDDMEGDMYEI